MRRGINRTFSAGDTTAGPTCRAGASREEEPCRPPGPEVPITSQRTDHAPLEPLPLLRRRPPRKPATSPSRTPELARCGHLQVDRTEPDDQEDGAPLVGLEDRVDARLEPRGDQGLDAGDRQFLVLGIGKVDDLGHEVAAVDDLVEVFRR